MTSGGGWLLLLAAAAAQQAVRPFRAGESSDVTLVLLADFENLE